MQRAQLPKKNKNMPHRESSALQELLLTDPGQTIILQKIDLQDYPRLMQTSYSMFESFKKNHLHCWLAKLAYHLAQEPDDVKVKFILKNNLNLLSFIFNEVRLRSVTVTHVTPLQLVYGAGDNKMCETLIPFFEKKYGGKDAGRAEMQKQINEMKNERVKFDFAPIIEAISNEPFNNGHDPETKKWILSPHTLSAIKKFREDFDASQPTIINKGMHFHWETLHELINAYAAAAAQWNAHYYYRCTLLEDVALSRVLSHIPENGAQYFNQGIFYLEKNEHNEHPEPFGRMKRMRDGHNFYDSLKQDSVDFSLDSSGVDVIFGTSRNNPENWARSAPARRKAFKSFVEQKLRTCRAFAAEITNFEMNARLSKK